jgi:Na+/H+ antiporter NhaD/arsenite permease-like protein
MVNELTLNVWMTTDAIISIIWLVTLFSILVTEKIDKTIVSVLIAGALIFMQVFVSGESGWASSQEVAWMFIYHNFDIFAFIIGMMIISWIAKDSWIFNYLALTIAQKVNGHPMKLFFILSYMAFILTIFISNIPTIIILAPIVILITKKLDIPVFPYIIWIITFANLGWAVTPISDPTTYYQATTLWFSFFEVVSNTGLIMLTVTLSSSLYLYIVFKKYFKCKPNLKALADLNPIEHIKDKKEMITSLSILFVVILIVVFKEAITSYTWLRLDNWTVTLFWAFLTILFLKWNVSSILSTKVDYATLFFFAWLFIVIGALEHNWVIIMLADRLVEITWWNNSLLLLMLTMGSAIISVFVDNIPYNIAMVSTLETFRDNGTVVWAAWMALAWGLNSCTSIWWAGSPIWAACNVVALWQASKTWIIIKFVKYLMIWVPLVIINSAIAYTILYFRYLG